MNKRRATCRALPRASWLFLLAAVALANGCASGDVAGQSTDEANDAATDSLPNPEARYVYACTLAQGLVAGSLEVFGAPGATATCRIAAPPQPNSSRQFCLGDGPIPPFTGTCPDCESLRVSLACLLMMPGQ